MPRKSRNGVLVARGSAELSRLGKPPDKGWRPGKAWAAKRPVEWLLWSTSMETALVVILEEAELLIPILRGLENPKAHLITYAAPVTKDMLPFSGLRY